MTLAEVLGGRPGRERCLQPGGRSTLSACSPSRSADTPERLAVLRAGAALTLPDCRVVLAAQDAGADAS